MHVQSQHAVKKTNIHKEARVERLVLLMGGGIAKVDDDDVLLLAALDIKRHHQNESETKEVIFPLERTLSTVQRITFQLPTNFIRPLLGSAKN